MEWYIWIIACLVFLILEMLVSGFFVVCISIGCLAAALVSLIAGATLIHQLAALAIATFIMFIAVRPFATKILHAKGKQIETNVDALIGKRGIVIEKINPTESSGRVKIGEDWKAMSANNTVIDKGQIVEVEKVEGTTLIVKPLSKE